VLLDDIRRDSRWVRAQAQQTSAAVWGRRRGDSQSLRPTAGTAKAAKVATTSGSGRARRPTGSGTDEHQPATESDQHRLRMEMSPPMELPIESRAFRDLVQEAAEHR
jgi:hypothetical protein